MKTFLILLIKGYRFFISPFLVSQCCYVPSCSVYACKVLKKYGLIEGGLKFLRRFVSCHPFLGHFKFDEDI